MPKYFVTGGTGYIGSSLVDELLAHGHEVLALSRSEKSAKTLREKGAQVHNGDLEDLDSLREGARLADGTLHLGFNHDYSRYAEVCDIDLRATKAIIEELQNTGKPFVYTSDLLTMPSPIGVQQDESNWPKADSDYRRTPTELFALESAKQGTKTIVVRLPPSVHGPGELALIPDLIEKDKKFGSSVYLDQGDIKWSAVHKNDAPRVFRLAIEKGQAGSVYHAVSEEGIKTLDIAKVISEKFNLPLRSLPKEKSDDELGFLLGYAYRQNTWVSSAKTREELGWEPKEIGLLDDIKQNY